MSDPTHGDGTNGDGTSSDRPAPDRLGFVGLGQMGALMAGHLVEWPGGLVCVDVRPEAVAPFLELGATTVDTLGELASVTDVIFVMVLDDAQTTQVVGELLTTAAPGTVIAIHSTIRPETAERLSEQAAEVGVHVVDAPVSGSTVGASTGTLAIMFGGDETAWERCREPFSRMATLVQRFGPAGAGTRAKIARNLITFVGFAAAGEAQRIADAAGVDLRRLGRVVKHSDGVTGGVSSVFLREHAVPYADDDFLRGPMEHARVLGEKDLQLAIELAESLGVVAPLSELALERLGVELGVPDP
jgi:3-hydroxyisobutyrate dehydrogenase-like beta-hydroxyacid dehydrogenase